MENELTGPVGEIMRIAGIEDKNHVGLRLIKETPEYNGMSTRPERYKVIRFGRWAGLMVVLYA